MEFHIEKEKLLPLVLQPALQVGHMLAQHRLGRGFLQLGLRGGDFLVGLVDRLQPLDALGQNLLPGHVAGAAVGVLRQVQGQGHFKDAIFKVATRAIVGAGHAVAHVDQHLALGQIDAQVRLAGLSHHIDIALGIAALEGGVDQFTALHTLDEHGIGQLRMG